MGADENSSRPQRRSWIGIILTGVLALLAFVVLAIYSSPEPLAQPQPPRVGVGSVPTDAGVALDIEPWEYDAENDRHWHPGHAHWHEGPPPEDPESEDAGEGNTATAPGVTPVPTRPTPEPWSYDAENNRHWFPAHNHWHEGPPPPESERP